MNNKKLLKNIKKLQNSQPSFKIGLKEEFMTVVPDDQKLEIIVHLKGKGEQPHVINPVYAYAVQGGKLKVINRNLKDTCYSFLIQDIKVAYIFPMEI